MLGAVNKYLELIRFQHTVFALPFALAAALLAANASLYDGGFRIGAPRFWIGILLCMVFARSLAMTFNRIVDRKYDADNPRTANRHLPAGLISLAGASLFAIASAVGFVACTLFFLPNWLPLALSAPVILWLCGYSYAKRFTFLAHAWLGVALMLAPICTWIALRGEVVIERPVDLLPAAALGAAVFCWVTGFDIIYACQDHDFDRSAGLHSIPARFGVLGALRISMALHFVAIACFALLGYVSPPLGIVYFAGVAATAALLVYEHSLVRENDLTRINAAFFQVNAVISIGLLIVIALDLVV